MINQQQFQATMITDVDDFMQGFSDDPNNVSAWGHNYFCADDGERLTYNRIAPKDHHCPICKREYKDEIYDQVWTYIYRNDALLTASKSFIIFKQTGEQEYLANAIKIIDFYASCYSQFKLHDKNGDIFETREEANWGCGRLMPQGLNESVAFLRLLVALNEVKASIPNEKLKEWKRHIFDVMFLDLKPQVNKIHNIPCWNLSLIGSIGICFDDQEMKEFAFASKFNILEQLKVGVTEDNFWFEGSIHYNFFTLEGVTYLLYFTKMYNQYYEQLKPSLKQMYIAGFKYAFDNDNLPNPNDGWPNLNLKTYSYQYSLATYTMDDPEMNFVYHHIITAPVKRGPLPLSQPYYIGDYSLEDYYFGTQVDFTNVHQVNRGSQNFEASNYAILKSNNTNVFLKYGHNGPSHAHPDKLNIEVMHNGVMYSKDLSNTGYGVALCNEWHRISSSHNTVVINGKNHVSTRRGKVILATDDHIIAHCDNVYTGEQRVMLRQLKERLNPDEVIKELQNKLGCTEKQALDYVNSDLQEIEVPLQNENKIDFTREIKLTENGFDDIFTVTQNQSQVIDYFLHFDQKLDFSNLETVEVDDLGFDQNGYQHLLNARKVKNVSTQMEFKFTDFNSKIILDDIDYEIYIVQSYSNPITTFRDTLILRKVATQAKYKIKWNFGGKNE